MKKLYLLVIFFIITSCGGGGGGGSTPPLAVPFTLTLGLLSFSVNEDEIYNGSLNATANENVTLEYLITTQSSNGNIQLNSSGDITYTPKLNYYGSDQFQYSVRAIEKNVTQRATVNITINSVDDPPSISFITFNNYSEDTILFEDDQSFRVRVNDIDTDYENLSYAIEINGQNIPATFIPDAGQNSNGSGSLDFNLISLQSAGLFDATINVSDSASSASLSFKSWFVSNKNVVTIQQDDTPDDGFEGNDKTSKDYLVYQLSGSPASKGRTKYLFVGDSLADQADIELYRRALIASVNKINASDASNFFTDDYFTIFSAEPVAPDGTSPSGVRTGCYDFDEDIYCIGDIDDQIFDVLLPDNTLVSTLTMVQGRGVNLGYKNIQRIRDSDPKRTSTTLMHELGHAHGYMGDEYRSDDDRDVGRFADLNVNTSTQSDVSLLKWQHHIDDLNNVLGKDIQVCYNYSDGTIGDWDDLGITVTDCDCFVNEWDSAGNFIRKNPECSGVGQFEGNYYGLYDNYRPTFCSIMDSCSSGGYGKVNVEGFAIGSLQNQGFYDTSDIGFTRNSSNENIGWQMILDVDFDTSKVALKWYVNGVEDPSKENQTTVTFNRPADNSVQVYTAKAIDLTGTITAEDDVTDNTDFYEGLFQSSFYWCAGYVENDSCDWSYDPNPSRYNEFDYGYMNGPLGVTWGINWARW